MMDVAGEIGTYAGVAAFIGIALLLPLYISQVHDLHRLRIWMALTPELRDAEREAAEAARVAEAAEATALGRRAPRVAPAGSRPAAGEPAPPAPPAPVSSPPAPPAPTPRVPPAPGTTPARPLSPAERIALDRPATERITGERTAVGPMLAGGRRRPSRLRTGRGLAMAVGAVLVLGVAVVFVALQLSDEADRPATRPGSSAVVPSEVEVAVLNGTAQPGLASNVSDDIEANEFVVGQVTNSEVPFEDSVVMFSPGSEREAQEVAKQLGIVRVQPMDPETRGAAGGAAVAVIAGEDRAAG